MARCQTYTVTLPSREVRDGCARQPKRDVLGGARHEVCSTSSRKLPEKKESARRKNHLASQRPTPEPVFPERLSMATTTAVKTNPLLTQPSSPHPLHCGTGAGGGDQEATEERPVFYGQRRNIRRTKEQEMISAISQLAPYGEKKYKRKSKTPSFLEKVRSIGSRSPRKVKFRSHDQHKSSCTRKAAGGPFILRPRPPLRNNNFNTQPTS